MYLKRLSLQGFKSFANRTSFDYDRGITAVVGPNGSGKSNVADAIRWVLGEQSSRLLRTKRQEDVIFAGTGGRAQVGMAEVLLTLDNSERWLPLDFAEVELGRRVYRNGDSEYLINGSRVRLRDITDLLLKGDVGQNSYSIMGQGLVDEVLSMSADDRRAFLDEAADVKRFRMKVREAQDRLAANRENTGKLSLIVTEIAPRLSQLARQAERAGEHRRLAAELSELLRVSFGHRWNEAQNGLIRARAMLDQRSAEDSAAADRVEQLRVQIRTLGDEIGRRRESIARRGEAARAHEQRVAALEQALALDRQRLEMLSQRQDEVRSEVQALEMEHASLLANLSGRSADEWSEMDEASVRVAAREAREALHAAEQALAAARTARDGARAGFDASERQLSMLQSELRNAQDRRAEIERQLHRDVTVRRQLLDELAAYAENFRDSRLAVARAHAASDSAGAAANAARERAIRVADDLRAFEDSRAEELRELDYLEGRLEALQRVEAEALGVAAGTRNVLALGGLTDDGPADVPGVIGMLAHQLQVPAGLEVALNAALENRLHAILVEDEQVALEAIGRIREKRLGRAQFLPMTMRPGHALNLQKERGVIGVAARLVRCDRRFQPVVDALLGRVIVVETVEAGRRMIARSLGSVVTLDGTFIDPSGAISGGASGVDDGIFVRRRELDELAERIAALRRRADSGDEQLQSGHQALEQIQQRAHDADRAFDEARRELEAARSRFERDRDRLPRLRREMNQLRARHADQNRQAQALESRLADAAGTVGRLLEGRDERQVQLLDLDARVDAASAEREQSAGNLAAASNRAAAIEAERRARQVLQQQQERALAQVVSRTEGRRDQLQRLTAEAAVLEARVTAAELELDQIRSVHAAENGDNAPDRDELERLESHERQLQTQLAEAQAELLQIDRRRLDLESEIERSLEQITALRTEIEREGLAVQAGGTVAPLEELNVTAVGPAVIQGGAPVDIVATQQRIEEIRRQIRRLGPVNDEAPEDFDELQQRHDYLATQLADLEAAETQLTAAIRELNGEIHARFTGTFEQVNRAFGEFFRAFFGGGNASLSLTDPENAAESGIEIEAQPPGKRLRSLSLLSGGERSLTAVALLFALLTANPSPFCVLDEVDAALDEANVGRFTSALTQLSEKTQFIVVTHNRRTVEAANAIYGVSMMRDGISKVLSLRLADLPRN